MACCGQREKFDNPDNEQKWDYINLSDFRSSSCLTPLSYGILYIFLLISVAVYVVDLFTCVNLLLFDKWSGQVQPAIPFEVSRWIFTACILLSYVLLAYRWWRAIRAMKTGVVAASYLDPLAVRVQSVRMGANGRGWRRFLVFAALTKGRKGAEYVALFTYFSFEAWLRICFAEGPRQVINALTLYSVMQANLVPTGQHAATKGHTPVVQFFVNLQILADKNREQAAILFGMLFTLVIWVFSALSLLLAVVFYITFLWHHVRDGSLSRYCRRKIDTRLHRIVMVRVNRALEKDQKSRAKQVSKGIRSVTPHGDFKRQPTVPLLDNPEGIQSDLKRQPTVPILDAAGSQGVEPMSRQTTHSRIASSGSLLPTHPTPIHILQREPTVPDVLSNNQRPGPPSRSTTQGSAQSNISYGDDVPLISSAAPLGYGPPRSNRAGPRINDERGPDNYGPTGRGVSVLLQSVQRPLVSTESHMAPPSRQNTDLSGRIASGFPPPHPQPVRKPMPHGMPSNPVGYPPGQPGIRRIPTQEYEMQAHLAGGGMRSQPQRDGGYVAFNADNQSNGVAPPGGPRPVRNLTQPQRPPPTNYFGSNPGPPQRSGTAPLPDRTPSNDEFYDAYGGSWQEPPPRSIPPRPATAGPGGWNGPRRPMPSGS